MIRGKMGTNYQNQSQHFHAKAGYHKNGSLRRRTEQHHRGQNQSPSSQQQKKSGNLHESVPGDPKTNFLFTIRSLTK
jgi:hypothetical protein